MQRRNAAQNYYYFSLLLVGILLSTVSRRLEPLWAVLPLVLVLVSGRLERPRPALTVQCVVAPQRAFEDDRLTVRITVKAATTLPPTELWHLLPPGADCPGGGNRLLFTLRRGESRTFAHQVVFPRRGKYILGRLYCRVHPGTDLQPLLAEYRCDQLCTIAPRITWLARSLRPLQTHVFFGNYVSRTAGEGLEFAGIRPYTSGDRLRRVHWRTSLQRQDLYVNDYYCERNADVVVLLDTLMAAGSGQANTLDIAVRTAASLAAHYLRQKDQVGLISYGGVCTWLLPGSGRRQLYRILEELIETRAHFSYLTKDITLVPPRVLPSGALVFAITSLLDPRFEVALHDLLTRAFQLVLVAISPVHAMRLPRLPDFTEATARLWRLETAWRLHEFRRLGVPVIFQESEDPWHDLFPIIGRGRVWQRAR